ncbi:MAG TPA: BTAD domain-containing putative transcriptional regulator [Chloroflexota bacterium]|nr:BTAD domain-containing putative transcriptional regulator [Chloroflexota bacterium]
MQRGAGGAAGTGLDDPSGPAMVDPTVILGLLIAALEMQRHTSLTLLHLMRGVPGSWTHPRRRLPGEIRPRGRVSRPAVPPLIGEHTSSAPTSADRPPVIRSVGAAPRLHVRCFGRFEVLRAGVPIEHWRRGKAKLLLKHLIARRQPVPRDVLIDLLWPEADPQIAVNGLRVALHALRQALGEGERESRSGGEYIVFESGNYSVNPLAGLWVDADEFDEHFATGLRLERRGQVAAARCHYEQAEAVYRDDYLLEDLYEDWTLVRREELKDQYLMVLTKLADGCLREGDAEGCIVRCHKILQKDACREDAYRRLMRCYAQLGQRSQALHWFGLCTRTLRQELDVAPSEQTMDLYQKITTGQRCDSALGDGRGRVDRREPGYRTVREV